MVEERLIDVETKIAHQEVQIEDLNQTIIRQQATIDLLETKITKLIERFKEVVGGTHEIGPANEKPPHY